MASKAIMVVDDSSTIRKILQREFSKADFEVVPAKNGMEALAMLEWADPYPDLITIDIDMPRMNGFELCSKIREKADSENSRKRLLSQTPIVFVSANDDLKNREKAYELEVLDFIGKPFVPGKMLQTVNNILNVQEQFSGMTALIVEDSPFVSRIVRNILKRHGLKVHEASDGKKALEIIKEKKFDIDIIITDYIMPGLSGEELCRTLRSIEVLENVPIFFISSINDKETTLNFFKVGANDYLPKPFFEEEFRARIVTHLRNRKYTKELEKLNSRLEFQADHDSLTGLYNRGYLQRELSTIFTQSQYGQGNLCCMLIDLDYFKKVNDDFGHAFGDLVLQKFAKIMTNNSRGSDIIARFGGEEFAILMLDTDLKGCLLLAEQIRTAAEGYIYNDGNTELQVTISSGLSSLNDHEIKNVDDLFSKADKALYAAKNNGRNRVEVYSA
ncbi:response regulator [Desulfogranum marinum]|uniref:response regulator n=1 Tax=Desulfogranum marinum TaxID=453220 RepID=UPI0019632DDB|nr:response regulator [Desulfogranum marinum]MBM9515109.1 response regulator [Desulfogranum marinum]